MNIEARLLTGSLTNRGTFLQQNIITEEVSYGYFKVPLYILDNGIGIIDIVGSKVIYGFTKKKDRYAIGKVRFTHLYYNKKGKLGFSIKGKFIKL